MIECDADTIASALLIVYVIAMFAMLFVYGWAVFFAMLFLLIMVAFVFVLSQMR